MIDAAVKMDVTNSELDRISEEYEIDKARERVLEKKPECGADPECDGIVFGQRVWDRAEEQGRCNDEISKTQLHGTTSLCRQIGRRDHHSLPREIGDGLFRHPKIIGEEMPGSFRQPIREAAFVIAGAVENADEFFGHRERPLEYVGGLLVDANRPAEGEALVPSPTVEPPGARQ